ncbi:MAG: hypothetical protein QM287_04160 [Bacillota bacterium]|nr:hypothetical protein [Bacillota bacterium]
MSKQLILWLSLAWLPVLLYFAHRNETRFKKNIVVEVTLPFQARTDPEVLGILAQFKKQILWVNLAMFLVTLLFFRIESDAVLTSAYMTWMVFAIALPLIPYVRTNLRLKKLKAARGWKQSRSSVKTFPLSNLPVVRWISPLAFLPGILLSFLPLLWDREMAPLYLTFGFSTIFFWLGYRYLYRNKAEMVDQNIELTQVLTRVRRYNWGKVWLISVYCFAGMSMVFFLLKQQPMLQMVLVMLLTFFVTVMAIRVEFRTRRIQETLTADSGKEWYVDEDDHWLGGIVYYNPDDSRLLINARVGINTTFNMAKTSGKVFSVMVVLLLLAMPFTGMFLHALDRQPLTLALTETTLIAHRGSKSELIDRADITEVELLLELPENMTRSWGNALDHQMAGRFTAPGRGSMQLSLDPTAPPYLLVTLTNGQKYLIGSREPGQTEAIYRNLSP